MINIECLDQKFALDNHISFTYGHNNMPIVKVENAYATAMIALQGAHVLGFQTKGQEPLIWMSEDAQLTLGKSLRGGVPICWPWFGSHVSDETQPAHGYARTAQWLPMSTATLSDGSHQIVLQLQDGGEHVWQTGLSAMLTVTVGKTLKLNLKTTNSAQDDVEFSEALHTYFYVGDVRKVCVEGLEGAAYLDKLENFKQKTQLGVITVASEVDRIYFNQLSQDKHYCCIIDHSLQRKIHIRSQRSAATVVWNPWSEVASKMGDLGKDGYLHMLCVETANTAETSVTLKAGSTHTVQVEYSTELF